MVSSYILAVLGVTGAGKSSFVRLVTGDSSIKIGQSYNSGKAIAYSEYLDLNLALYRDQKDQHS
jgi:ABC-type hemin transport system ATPase subunit